MPRSGPISSQSRNIPAYCSTKNPSVEAYLPTPSSQSSPKIRSQVSGKPRSLNCSEGDKYPQLGNKTGILGSFPVAPNTKKHPKTQEAKPTYFFTGFWWNRIDRVSRPAVAMGSYTKDPWPQSHIQRVSKTCWPKSVCFLYLFVVERSPNTKRYPEKNTPQTWCFFFFRSSNHPGLSPASDSQTFLPNVIGGRPSPIALARELGALLEERLILREQLNFFIYIHQ